MTGEDLDAVDGAGARCRASDSGAFCADCFFGGRLSVNSRQSILTRHSSIVDFEITLIQVKVFGYQTINPTEKCLG